MTQRQEFTEAMTKVISAAQTAAQVERFYKVVGGGIGLAARVFGLPWLAIYAWNGLTPENWAHWEYLPTVAAFVVINVLISTIRGSSK